MCPACMASAVLTAGSLIATGGLTALLVKIFRSKKAEKTFSSNNLMQRRDEDGYSDDRKGTSESCAAR
jgi:hypothetical protein